MRRSSPSGVGRGGGGGIFSFLPAILVVMILLTVIFHQWNSCRIMGVDSSSNNNFRNRGRNGRGNGRSATSTGSTRLGQNEGDDDGSVFKDKDLHLQLQKELRRYSPTQVKVVLERIQKGTFMKNETIDFRTVAATSSKGEELKSSFTPTTKRQKGLSEQALGKRVTTKAPMEREQASRRSLIHSNKNGGINRNQQQQANALELTSHTTTTTPDDLADIEGEAFKKQQSANELIQLRNMLKEQQNMMRREREEERELEKKQRKSVAAMTTGNRRGRAGPPSAASSKHSASYINCQCYGLSGMDQRQNWCRDMSGRQGSKVSAAHFCIVEDLCLEGNRGNERLYFKSKMTQAEANAEAKTVSINLANGVRLDAQVLFDPSSPAQGAAVSGKGQEYKWRWGDIDPSKTDAYERGMSFSAKGVKKDPTTGETSSSSPSYATVAILGHSAASHITHFLEPIGNLQMAVKEMMVPPSPEMVSEKSKLASKICDPDDLGCFYRPEVVLSNRATIDRPDFWGSHVLRMILGDIDPENPRQVTLQKLSGIGRQVDALRGSSNSKKTTSSHTCFKKAVIPGAFYGVWPAAADTKPFLQDLDKYLQQPTDHHLLQQQQQKTSSPPSVVDWKWFGGSNFTSGTIDSKNVIINPESDRLVLIAHRTSKRMIADFDNFLDIVGKEAAKYGAKVGVIKFGSLSFKEQALAANQAGVLMGIHGADLTNMLFQKRGSVVVELNPFLFFENRFYEMASALGHKYMPWNCGSHQCAFGGITKLFRNYVAQHKLRYNFSDYTITTKEHGSFPWGWKGYLGYGCLACNHVTCCTGVKDNYYSELRESDIFIGPSNGKHAAEIRSVLRDAFEHLEWDRVV